MKKLAIPVLVLILLIAAAFIGYTLIKSKQAKTPPDLVVKEGILKTKIGNEYLLDTGSGLVSLINGQANPINLMKQKIRVEQSPCLTLTELLFQTTILKLTNDHPFRRQKTQNCLCHQN